MKKTRILLALLALALAMTVTLPAAMAYFTTKTSASGAQTLELGGSTTILEDLDLLLLQKKATITATPNSQPMYLRARVFAGDIGYTVGEGWTKVEGEDWYYYSTPLSDPVVAYDGEKTTVQTAELLVQLDELDITGRELADNEIPKELEVTIVYQTTPIQYTDDLRFIEPQDADWSTKVTVKQEGVNAG